MTLTSHQKQSTGALWWARRILSWLLLFFVLALLALTVIIPRATGAVPYTVLTSSMEPAYPPGTLIVVRDVDPNMLSIGTPITYQIESGQPDVITHRIIAVEQNGHGERTFITQGDSNTAPDSRPVRPAQVRGEVWYSVPYLGYLNSWITGGQHTLLLGLAIAALLIYAAYMFISGARESSHTKRQKGSGEVDSRATQ